MEECKARFIGVNRHRIATDGDGVTSLVAFHGCPLRCRYCLNPHSLVNPEKRKVYSPREVFEMTRVDELYYLATNGGVTFGGGEPALNPRFIKEFRDLCGPVWKLNIETSLNVPKANIETILPVVDTLIIDIKDMNPEIYRAYTGCDNLSVIENLCYIVAQGRQDDCVIRIPLIPGYNNEADRSSSREALEAIGFTRFNLFNYIVREH